MVCAPTSGGVGVGRFLGGVVGSGRGPITTNEILAVGFGQPLRFALGATTPTHLPLVGLREVSSVGGVGFGRTARDF